MEYFVDSESIVRKIWGKSDTVLFVFAGAAAEFALNKAVDWLYFTGRLPSDPLGRLFSTAMYARRIVFAEKTDALKTIDEITHIHKAVEKSRGASIPDWAYRDVLFMLIHYSIASFELLERKLTYEEKEGLFDVFYRMGTRMELKGLPNNFTEWLTSREEHLQNDLIKSDFTADLFKRYKYHLGAFRYQILLETQKLIVPCQVKRLLGFGRYSLVKPMLFMYKSGRSIHLDNLIRSMLLPNAYKRQIKELDIVPS